MSLGMMRDDTNHRRANPSIVAVRTQCRTNMYWQVAGPFSALVRPLPGQASMSVGSPYCIRLRRQDCDRTTHPFSQLLPASRLLPADYCFLMEETGSDSGPGPSVFSWSTAPRLRTVLGYVTLTAFSLLLNELTSSGETKTHAKPGHWLAVVECPLQLHYELRETNKNSLFERGSRGWAEQQQTEVQVRFPCFHRSGAEGQEQSVAGNSSSRSRKAGQIPESLAPTHVDRDQRTGRPRNGYLGQPASANSPR
ncbi:hypothetical protein GE09DRAFT_515842 [Coniochaeta sp. 2T2.1]|nr:hypothetical protein GE09DRAFT_515842 [Coniochaeta sp. 2T2.1]